MEYNTKRSSLLMREYGRNVQNIVQLALAEEDPERRKDLAYGVVELMALLNPGIKQQENWRHKLWDHLHIIADYELEVESPFEKPDREVVEKKPERIAYPTNPIRARHYGRNMEALIEKCVATEDPLARYDFSVLIANFMKHVYGTYNHRGGSVSDEQIKNDLKRMSGGAIELPDDLVLTQLDKGGKSRPQTAASSNKRNRGGRNKKRGNYRRRR